MTGRVEVTEILELDAELRWARAKERRRIRRPRTCSSFMRTCWGSGSQPNGDVAMVGRFNHANSVPYLTKVPRERSTLRLAKWSRYFARNLAQSCLYTCSGWFGEYDEVLNRTKACTVQAFCS